MTENSLCPQCSSPLPPDCPSGLCPKCLLQLGFESEPKPGESTGTYQPKFLAPTPERLAPYFPELEIMEIIGHGGMGVVYKARQKDLDRIVALKILRPDLDQDPSFAERFQREARTLAQLNHPNIISIHHFGRKDELYFLLMEYVDGTNLRQLERAARLKPEEALTIVPKICEALQYAHSQGVVHRDIKPENILITQEGRVKIADFGLAKLSGATDQELTGTWQIMGTPHYMAPEQFESPTEVDHRADIFSLGVVIYEMLTGELPLGRFRPPSEKSTADRRLDDVVQRALDKEPDRRYQQASDVQSDVEHISSTAGERVGSNDFNLGNWRMPPMWLSWWGVAQVVLALVTIPLWPATTLGLATGTTLYFLGRHLARDGKASRWLWVVSLLPVSMFFMPNLIVVSTYLISNNHPVWKRTKAWGRGCWSNRRHLKTWLWHAWQFSRRQFRHAFALVLGLVLWSGLCIATAFVVDKWLDDFTVYDESASSMVPASGAYKSLSLKMTSHKLILGRNFSEVVDKDRWSQSRLQLIMQPNDGKFNRVDFDLTGNEPRSLYFSHSKLDSVEEVLQSWMEDVAIDVDAPEVQQEIKHLAHLVNELHKTKAVKQPVRKLVDANLFTIERPGRLNAVFRSDRDIQFALYATGFVIWLIGTLFILGSSSWQWYLLTRPSPNLNPLINWTAYSLIAGAALCLILAISVDWLDVFADLNIFAALPLAKGLPYKHILLTCLGIQIATGLILRTGLGRWQRWLIIPGCLLEVLLLPCNFLTFPAGFQALSLVVVRKPQEEEM